MLFCYAGLTMFSLCFCVTFWQMFRQWFKAENFQKRAVTGEDLPPSASRDHVRQLRRGSVEGDCRAYAFACLIASGVFAALTAVIGGIIWACGG